ncbi:MAG: Fic family protein [Patescibacteria group bacterium]
MFIPKYNLTDKIVKALTSIAEAKAIIENAKILPQQELHLRREAIIRMTHHSTEIEGNRLNLQQVSALYAHRKVDAPDRDIYEVKNYLNALKYIEQVVSKKLEITEKIILKIHKLVTAKTLHAESCGYYRKGPIYVVRRRLGMPQEIMYTGPAAKKVPKLMADLIDWLQKSINKDINPIIVAGIAHLEIAAIHPFNDGNGRTARALATLILYERGYDFRHLFALEDYYNTNRQEYYKAINVGKNFEERRTDLTSWIEYFVNGFKEEIDSVKTKITMLSIHRIDEKIKSQIYLTKDQLKILDFLDQLGKVNVNDIVDILSCPKRTAQYHLKKLKNIKMIKQVGKGPRAAYIAG